MIRQATINDIPQIKEMLIASWVEHAQNASDILDEERMRRSNVEKYYTEALNDPNSFIKVAEMSGQFAGFIRVDIKDEGEASFFKYKKYVCIDDIAVIPEFRGKHIGHDLIQLAEEIAKEKGLKQIQARVYSYNNPMQQILRD